MRMHTKLTASQVIEALQQCVSDGKVAAQVSNDAGFKERRSTKNVRAFEIQLGAMDNEPFVSAGVEGFLRQNVVIDPSDKAQAKKLDKVIAATGRRRPRNHASASLSLPYSATWYEWGFLIAALFDLDDSLIFGEYTSRENFIEFTRLRHTNINDSYFTPRGMNWFNYRQYA